MSPCIYWVERNLTRLILGLALAAVTLPLIGRALGGPK